MSERASELRAELRRLRERVEYQHRRNAATERRLRDAMAKAGLAAETVEALPPAPRARTPSQPPRPRAPMPDRAFWPSRMQERKALVPTPGLANYSLKGEPLKVIGVSVCGFGRADLEKVVDMVSRQQEKNRDFAPVFLTDSTEFDVFRRHGFVFEYMPPPAQQPEGTEAWDSYAEGRLQLIKRKWNLAQIITFGPEEFGYRTDDDVVRPSVRRETGSR